MLPATTLSPQIQCYQHTLQVHQVRNVHVHEAPTVLQL